VAQLVQYVTFPLQNIGFLEGAHTIAAELTTCGVPGVEPQIVAELTTCGLPGVEPQIVAVL